MTTLTPTQDTTHVHFMRLASFTQPPGSQHYLLFLTQDGLVSVYTMAPDGTLTPTSERRAEFEAEADRYIRDQRDWNGPTSTCVRFDQTW